MNSKTNLWWYFLGGFVFYLMYELIAPETFPRLPRLFSAHPEKERYVIETHKQLHTFLTQDPLQIIPVQAFHGPFEENPLVKSSLLRLRKLRKKRAPGGGLTDDYLKLRQQLHDVAYDPNEDINIVNQIRFEIQNYNTFSRPYGYW